MSTIVRRKRQSRRELGPYRRYELLCGEIVYPAQNYDGYGDGIGRNLVDFISDEMRADWEANRDELIAFWKSGNIRMICRGCLFVAVATLCRGRRSTSTSNGGAFFPWRAFIRHSIFR